MATPPTAIAPASERRPPFDLLPIEADDGSRTRDLELGKLALYQLSYRRAGVKRTYQAWSVPQCGQPTEVVTSALNT